MVVIWCLISLIVVVLADPIVQLRDGTVRGAWKKSYKGGRSYASFEGLRFAQPPIGKLRFKAPRAPEPWLGEWDATTPKAECLQYNPYHESISGSEDCLYLNVYTPKLNSSASLPVLINIHGGAFMYGTALMGNPVRLMDKDIVVVTTNYRLGPLGFLSTGDAVVPGNNGLKDQSQALHWIQKNIVHFGGNPDEVTLMGCSAGGASVHYHYLSPMSNGTFVRGAAISGAAFAPWTIATRPAEKALILGSKVGCPTKDSHVLVECLSSRPAEDIVKAQLAMFAWKVNYFGPFTPTVEPLGGEEPFLTESSADVTQTRHLPLIASVTSHEGLYPAAVYQTDPALFTDLETRWGELASIIFEYNDTLPVKYWSSVADAIREHYLGGKAVGQETFDGLVQALGDRHFAVDVGKLAESHARTGQPTYLYRYSFTGKFSLSHEMAKNEKNYGACHADDYLHLYATFPSNEEDEKMSDLLVDLFYNYASTGVPNLQKYGVDFGSVNPNSSALSYLDLSSPSTPSMKTTADFGQKIFWNILENVQYVDKPLSN